MNTAERGGVPPEPREGKPRFVVGAEKSPGGTWDYSRAMEWRDPSGRLAKGFEELRRREQEARARRLEIPKDVKPGSARMVEYTLRNTIIVNQEAANKAREDGRRDERREALIRGQRMQQTMLDNANMRFSQDLIKRGLDTGQGVTAEQAQERSANLTADEMHGLVQQYIIDHCERLEVKGEEVAYLQEGHSGRYYPIKDLLKEARGLQIMLIAEASRGDKN
jgi:hypothetical protein